MDLSRLRNLAVSENGFAFDPTTGYSYQLSPLAVEYFNLLLKDKVRNEILEYVVEEYDVEGDVASQDYDFFLLQLSNLGLLGSEDAVPGALEQ